MIALERRFGRQASQGVVKSTVGTVWAGWIGASSWPRSVGYGVVVSAPMTVTAAGGHLGCRCGVQDAIFFVSF